MLSNNIPLHNNCYSFTVKLCFTVHCDKIKEACGKKEGGTMRNMKIQLVAQLHPCQIGILNDKYPKKHEKFIESTVVFTILNKN